MRVATNLRPGPVQSRTIVGIGLNFLPHAADLTAQPTELPTLFFKGGHTVIGPGDAIPLPPMSQRVTAEAELGLIIGRRMYQVTAADALDYVAGGCCVLDQTAEDILRLDSRMLTLSKNFPGFFSFGPDMVSLDELGALSGGLDQVRVSTYLNGTCARSATVADMRFGPAELLAFISQVMPLECGDIVSTGTPGAVVLTPGDVVECRISGLRPLANEAVTANKAVDRC
jgi:2-keto-4-pentenoate hydratase/2-oxohepta-3-ene-1,7-dioic acid hydratase in catechol pathway